MMKALAQQLNISVLHNNVNKDWTKSSKRKQQLTNKENQQNI